MEPLNGVTMPVSPGTIQNPGATTDMEWEKRRMKRLIAESLEVALFICNMFLDRFGLATLFHIFNQILPTAFILNSGYWVFYSTQQGFCICICQRFGFRCPHQRNDYHWIDIAAANKVHDNFLFSAQNGKMIPVHYNIIVEPIIHDIIRAFDINITLVVQPFDLQGPKRVPVSDQKTTLCIETRFIITPQFNSLLNVMVQFNPHPMTHPYYGKYFLGLKKLDESYITSSYQLQLPRNYSIVCAASPNFTVISNSGTISNYYRNPEINLTAWSAPFAAFYGNFSEAITNITNINQQYVNINLTQTSITGPMMPYPFPPPPYHQVVSNMPPPSYHQQVLPYQPPFAYNNYRTSRRPMGNQNQFPNAGTSPVGENKQQKPKKRSKSNTQIKQKNEPLKSTNSCPIPPVSQKNPTCYQSPASLLNAAIANAGNYSSVQFSSTQQGLPTNVQSNQHYPPTRKANNSDETKPLLENNFLDSGYDNNFPPLPIPSSIMAEIPKIEINETMQNNPNDNPMEMNNIAADQYGNGNKDSNNNGEAIQNGDDSGELLKLMFDVITGKFIKSDKIIKAETFDKFQKEHSKQLETYYDLNSSDDDCLYIDEVNFATEMKK